MKLAIAVLLALAAPAHAECVEYGLVVKHVLPPDLALPADGGIVIYSEPVAATPLAKGDPALIPSWTWKSGGKPTVVSLAPGLAVVRPKRDALIDDKGVLKVSLSAPRAMTKPVEAPKVKGVSYTRSTGRRGGEEVVVQLEAAPSTAVFIVLLDDKRAPKSWRMIADPGKTELPAYSQAGCIALPNGTRPTKPGDLVRVAFVDYAGRMSAPSSAFKVVEKASPRSP